MPKSIRDLIEEIHLSSMPLEAKLCALWGLQNTVAGEYKARQAFRDTLLNAMPIGKPMRVCEIRDYLGLTISVQKLSAELHPMVYFGLGLVREEMDGEKITVKCREFDYHTYRYNDVEKEVDTTLVLYTRVR